MSRFGQWLWRCRKGVAVAVIVAGSWAPTSALAQDAGGEGMTVTDSTQNDTGDDTQEDDGSTKIPDIKPDEHAAIGSGTSPWYTSVTLGSEFMPNYKEGKSTGLNRQQFFARIVVDGAWQVWRPQSLLHAGADVELRGVPVVRGESQDGTQDTKTIPDKFADVANAITSSVYFDLPVTTWDSTNTRNKDGDDGICDGATAKTANLSRAAVRLASGVISREEKADNDDTVIWFASVGVRYSFDEYRAQCHRNGLPAGYISLSGAYFEDYAGLKDRVRLLVDAAYRLTDVAPVYLGFRSNLGSGPDELSVTFSVVFNSKKVLGLFGQGG